MKPWLPPATLRRTRGWVIPAWLVAGLAPATTPTQAPVAYWDFEGGIAHVLPTNGAVTTHGGDTGSVSVVSAPAVRGLQCLEIRSGSAQPGGHLHVAGTLLGPTNTTYTLAAWFRFDDISGDGATDGNVLFSLRAGVEGIAEIALRPFGNARILRSSGSLNWDGHIDDLVLYASALAANQVAALADGSAAPGALPPPVADPPLPGPVPYAPGTWQFAVLPDLQHYVGGNGGNRTVLYCVMDWLVAQRDTLGIGFVGTTGDVTPRNRTKHWDRLRPAFDRLDGVLPYLLCLGNHDTGHEGWAQDRDIMRVNDYFDLSDNSAIDPATGGTFREAFETGVDGDPRFESTVHEFIAPDGQEFLLISLEFAPRQAVVDWASAVCDRPEYREHTGILFVHSYVYEDDTLYLWPDKNDTNGMQAANVHTYGIATPGHDVHDGTELWIELVKAKPQFRMVFCGSVSASDGVGYVADRNDFGFTPTTRGGRRPWTCRERTRIPAAIRIATAC